jgi:glycosyltransferase involved in cell wall biosynthesis
MEKLSVAIITLNEERNIARCLASVVNIADEIIIIDSFSTDKTKVICAQFGAIFEPHTFEGYIQQKQYALTRCSHRFVLSLDADEALSDTLESTIKEEKLKGFPSGAYTMNRLTNYCGQWISYCGWYPDVKLRLFDKNKGYWGGINPHDKVILPHAETSVTHLKGDMLHFSYYSIDEHYRQADRFATIAAQSLANKGKRSSYLHATVKMIAKFVRNYFIKTGFMDGYKGLTICKISALETWWKYTRLMQINRQKHENSTN